MTQHHPINLDYLAAAHAQKIIQRTKSYTGAEVDNTVTKSLGVLQENGIYACALYLLSRSPKEAGRAKVIMEECLNLLAQLGFGWDVPRSFDSNTILSHISTNMMSDLERLLLAKETLEQMLTFARYGAKARTAEGRS